MNSGPIAQKGDGQSSLEDFMAPVAEMKLFLSSPTHTYLAFHIELSMCYIQSLWVLGVNKTCIWCKYKWNCCIFVIIVCDLFLWK